MMTDRELLEDAARAIALDAWWSETYGMMLLRSEGNRAWRPLDNDGDSMRLALALAERLSRTGRVLCLSIGMNRSGCEFNFIDGPDQGANTRRAIVVAAATMAPMEPR